MTTNSTVRVGLRIPYDLNTQLIKTAQRLGQTKNGLVLQILWAWIDAQK